VGSIASSQMRCLAQRCSKTQGARAMRLPCPHSLGVTSRSSRETCAWSIAMLVERQRCAPHAVLGGDLEQCHRIRRFLMVAQTPTLTHSVNQTRCERGAQRASVLEFPATTSEAIVGVDEQWCGLGYPFGRLEPDIPVRSHIARHQRRPKRIGASAAPQRQLRPFARGEVQGSTRRWSPSWSPSIAIMGGGPASPTPNGSGNPWSCWSLVASSWSPRTSGSIALRLRQWSTRSPSAMHDIR